jgi:hypothetical protein
MNELVSETGVYIEAVGSLGWTNFPAPPVISFPNFVVPQWPQHLIFETDDAHTFVNVSTRLCNLADQSCALWPIASDDGIFALFSRPIVSFMFLSFACLWQ